MQWYGETKHRADARLALCSDVSSHQFNELFANRQSQARASVLSGGRAVGLHKRLKQFAECAGSNADPIVDDGKPDMGDVSRTSGRFIARRGRKFKPLLGRSLIEVYVHGNRAPFAKFDGVRQQITEDLL